MTERSRYVLSQINLMIKRLLSLHMQICIPVPELMFTVSRLLDQKPSVFLIFTPRSLHFQVNSLDGEAFL